MLSPPGDLTDDELASALARRWRVAASSVAYRPVGFGSHHWEIGAADGARWFVTVDELRTDRAQAPDTALNSAFGRLRASLAAASELRDHGCEFVVAPVPTIDGEPLARLGARFAVALYPFVDGQSFEWGEFSTPAHRRAALDLVVAVHAAPPPVRRHAMVDDFLVPHRDELQAALRSGLADDTGECGPYARAAAGLVAQHAGSIGRLLARYDDLVASTSARPSRAVLTHGEPHPGNTMRTPAGWLLIDWDTALVAPPERDLWILDPGDGSVLDAYAEATGVTVLEPILDLYRIRWTIADIAVEVRRFRASHTGSADDDQAWEILRSVVTHLDT